jgi:nucleotide-binding universal stress UspA family protein
MTNPRTTVVGCDARPATVDALALAVLLEPEARLLLATAVPPRLLSGQVAEEVRRAGEAVLADAAARIPGDRAIERHALNGRSPAEALTWLAEDQQADLLVVGSSRDAERGEVHAGSVGRGLLTGAPCPVAIAPGGFALDVPGTLRRVGIAWTDAPEAREAVAWAKELELGPDAERVLVQVADVDPSRALWGYEGYAYALATFPEELVAEARRELDAAAREHALPGRLREGDPAEELIEATRELDLLVVGSRAHGPLLRAALGSVSDRVVRAAHCPVVVVPRGAGHHGGPEGQEVPGVLESFQTRR